MYIPDFYGQQQNSLRQGLELGNTLRFNPLKEQQMQLQSQAMQNDLNMNPLRQQALQQQVDAAPIMQKQREQSLISSQIQNDEDMKKMMVQDTIALASSDREVQDKMIPEMINKYTELGDNQAVTSLTAIYEMDEKERMTSLYQVMNMAQQQGIIGGKKSAEQKEFESLTEGLTSEQKKLATEIKLGLKPRAVGDAITTAMKNGDITNLAEAKAELKEAEKFAEATGSSRARIIDAGFDKMNKIDEGISNIDSAISALGSGAGTGAIEKFFPSIKAASVELDNIRGKMALDVVGATTFGALSKGELDLAKDIALPTGLNDAELTDYLIRKKDAQQKLRDYYYEQIQHLDQGGTVASFMREKEREKESLSLKPESQPANEAFSPKLNRAVTGTEISEIMNKTGLSLEQVKERLGM